VNAAAGFTRLSEGANSKTRAFAYWLPWTMAVHRHNTFSGLARFVLEPPAEKRKEKEK